ncbi:MFS transporter, DHA2 family, multidrug resistance protein [Actinomadura glauciflava]|uniref:MFS transporter n=1 Tax=Actinomadura luteofluorescens TaxID=46163 RepID=UPI0021649D10|nr:MFS transporter [Actinomadura glauciflava]MCR3742171.1 MFS transporter, DHA2 family, multidrug resistance protein [Actinomadura glauciflava]
MEHEGQGAGSVRAGTRGWLALAVLALPSLLMAMDMTALLLALPQLSTDLGASGTEQLWISDAYGFMVAGFVITMGTLGDRIGRRRLLLTGAAAFAVLSAVAAYAPDPGTLIAARALLGVAGATLMPSTLALIINIFRDERERGKAIAIWATCQFAGGAFGPVLAGLLLQRFWWGSVFLVAVPVMALLLAAGPVLLPEFRDRSAGRRIDPLSVALSLGAVLPMVYGMKQLTLAGGHGVAAPAAALVGGALVGAVFVRRQLTLDHPLLDLRLLRSRPLSAVLVSLVFAGVAMAGTGLMVTQYLQDVLGHSPLASAVLFAPMGLGVAAGTMAAPALAKRVRPATAIASGLALSAAGCLPLLVSDGLVPVIAGITVLALGTGPLFALGTGLVVGSVPPERAGSAASMSETGNYLGGSLGLAVIGVIGASVYQARMDHVGGAAARTLAGAVADSGHLPPARAGELLDGARAAFTAGLHVTGAIAAAIFAVLAVLVAASARRGAAPEPAPAAEAEARPAGV